MLAFQFQIIAWISACLATSLASISYPMRTGEAIIPRSSASNLGNKIFGDDI